MRIWVDADACPGVVREIVIKAAIKREVPAVFVANKPLFIPASQWLSAVTVGQGPDVVDRYIVEHAEAGDLAITQDIPLASDLLGQDVVPISPHGTEFTAANMGDRLASRNLMQDLRDAGMIAGGPKPFGEKEKRQFANTFDQVLSRLLRGK